MKNIKSKKVVIMFVLLAFIMSFSENAFAAVVPKKQKVALERTWTSPVSKGLKEISSSKTQNLLSTSFDVTSSSDLTSRIQYILNNRLTDVNLHITYSFDVDQLGSQLKDLLETNPPVDEYVYSSITYLSYSGSGYDGDYNIPLKLEYVETKAQADAAETKVRQILSQIIKTGMSDLDKEKAIHDYIVSNVAYDESLTDHSDYGALFNHTTVCQGYALLTYKMLTDAGIKAKIVISNNDNSETGHAWNMVQINGVWYHLDCTFDDPVPDVPGRVEYNYFNKTDDEIASDGDHQWDKTKYPAATTKFNFDTAFNTNTDGVPSINSVTLSKNGEIDVETSNASDGTKVSFNLVHEDGSDASQTNEENNITILDDNPIILEGNYSGNYYIPEYVPEGNYKIKVAVGSVAAYSNVISVKRDSQITVNNLHDGYYGSNISSTVTGTISDKDGIDNAYILMINSNGETINLTTGAADDNYYNTIDDINLNSDGTFSQSIPAIDELADGKYTIEIRAFDSNEFETVKKIPFTKDSSYDWQKLLDSKPWKTKYSSFAELSTLMDVGVNKKFNVKFSQDVDFLTLSNSNVQIIDAASGQVVSSSFVKLSNNSVQIAPKSNLTAGRVYYIVIDNTNVKSASGKSLKSGVICPFKVADN